MDIVISLLDSSGTRSDYDCFQIELCRDEDCNKILRLEGHHVNLCMWMTIRVFKVDEESMDDALEICEMLNFLIEVISDGNSEVDALEVTETLYLEHFKYLAELGYQSPSEGGGVAP